MVKTITLSDDVVFNGLGLYGETQKGESLLF